jgi:hypothetical protein
MNASTQTALTLPITSNSQKLEEQLQYLTFILSAETYAASILHSQPTDCTRQNQRQVCVHPDYYACIVDR